MAFWPRFMDLCNLMGALENTPNRRITNVHVQGMSHAFNNMIDVMTQDELIMSGFFPLGRDSIQNLANVS